MGDLPLLGFGLPVSGAWATPTTMLHVARRAEELGWASLWTFQRLLQPVAGTREPSYDATQDPGARGVGDPAHRAVHDPLLPLALVAGHTNRIRLGTATICAPFVPPVVLARQVTTMDHLSGGRVTVGLGMGWLPQEHVAAGVPLERRGARLEDYLRCLEALWTQDPVQHAGEHYTVPLSHAGPRPVQQPHPPVLIGGSAPAALRRAGRLAQGWIAGTGHDLASVGRGVRLVREGAREAGRDPDAVRVLVRVVVDLTDVDPGPGRSPLHGTREQVLDDLAALREQGATEVLVDLNFSPRVTTPGVPVEAATTCAEEVLVALAPGGRP